MFLQDALPRTYETFDEGDPKAYGPDGVVRDGVRLRCKMTAMDAAPPQRAAPRSITTGMRMDRFYYPDGTEKPARTPRAERHLPAADADQHSANRPGFRTADAVTVDAGQALKDAAYAEMVRDNERAWMPDHMRVADAQVTVADAARPQGVSDADWARHLSIQDTCNAWRQDAAAVSTPPSGAFAPTGFGARAGDICTKNGVPGNLVERDGFLFCEVHQPGPTRSGASSGRDAAVGDRSLQDAAWRQMVEDQTNAWRT